MDYIYHYTSVGSLLGMLHDPTEEERNVIEANGHDPDYGYYLEFHASDLDLMNDKNENLLWKKVAGKMRNDLADFLEFAKWIKGQAYCVSFCTEADYIPMWKIYAANNPVCLKFKMEGFEDTVRKLGRETVDVHMRKCSYVSEKTFKKQAEKYRKDILRLKELQPTDKQEYTFPKLMEIMQDSAFLKLECFKYEHEFRIAAFINDFAKYKQGKYGIALYYPIKIPLRFLEEIIIGPSVNQDIQAYSVEKMLRSKGLHSLKQYGIEVKVSTTDVQLR